MKFNAKYLMYATGGRYPQNHFGRIFRSQVREVCVLSLSCSSERERCWSPTLTLLRVLKTPPPHPPNIIVRTRRPAPPSFCDLQALLKMGVAVYAEEKSLAERVASTPENPVLMKHGVREKSMSMLTMQRRRQDLIKRHAVSLEEVSFELPIGPGSLQFRWYTTEPYKCDLWCVEENLTSVRIVCQSPKCGCAAVWVIHHLSSCQGCKLV